jgi:acetolactate synthase-1/2/3 large subunit
MRIANSLYEMGFKHIFAIPGIQSVELYDAFSHSKIEIIRCLEERSCTFMANGYARALGETALLLLTSGPGITNSMSGICEAFLDSTPLLILTTGKSKSNLKKFALHDIDQVEILKPIVKAVFCPTNNNEIINTLRTALDLCKDGEPGPCVIIIPEDLLFSSLSDKKLNNSLNNRENHPINPKQIESAISILTNSKRIGIYAGLGAMEAGPDILELAEFLNAPIATTISGRGVIPEDHPLSVGFGFGPAGSIIAENIFKEIDVLLSIGCKFGQVSTGSYGLNVPKNHIQIDKNLKNIGANYPATPVVGDSKIVVNLILENLRIKKFKAIDYQIKKKILNLKLESHKKNNNTPKSSEFVCPRYFLQTLRSQFNRDSILTTDSGSHQFWALSDYEIFSPRTFITPSDFQAMGFGVPAAIGAAIASPKKNVLALVGDGGFLMSGFESLITKEHEAKIIFIIFCDGKWGLIAESQKLSKMEVSSVKLPSPDYQLLAKSFDLKYLKIQNDYEVKEALENIGILEKSLIIEVNISYKEISRYVKGSAPQMLKNLPWSVKAKVIPRYISRYLKSFTNRGTS